MRIVGRMADGMKQERFLWDVFISHASEDKELAARPLAQELSKHGLRVWLDERELRLGDSLQRKIDEGLSASRFGIIILSQAFFEKNWTQRELDGLVSRETAGRKVILPIWHNITLKDVARKSPTLAGKLSVNSSLGWEIVASQVLQAVGTSVLVSRFKTIPERKSPSLCCSSINTYCDEDEAIVEVQFTKESRKKFSVQDAAVFVQKILKPTLEVIEVITGNDVGVAKHGRIIESNPSYSGHERSHSFHIPFQGVSMRTDLWNEVTVEIFIRHTEYSSRREIDYGFLDTSFILQKIQPEQKGKYVAHLENAEVRKALERLSDRLSAPLGRIGALCLQSEEGELLVESPVWSDPATAAGEAGYVLRGMLR